MQLRETGSESWYFMFSQHWVWRLRSSRVMRRVVWWQKAAPLKRRKTSTTLHCVTTQKTAMVIVATHLPINHFNIILPATLLCPKPSLSTVFPTSSHVFYVSSSCHPWFEHLNIKPITGETGLKWHTTNINRFNTLALTSEYVTTSFL